MDGASEALSRPIFCWQDFAAVMTEMEGVFFLAIPAKLQVIFLFFFLWLLSLFFFLRQRGRVGGT